MSGGEAVGLDGGEAVRLVGEEAVRLSGDREVGVHKSISPHTSHRGVFWYFSGYRLSRHFRDIGTFSF